MNDIRKPTLRKEGDLWKLSFPAFGFSKPSAKYFEKYTDAVAYLTGVPLGAPTCQVEQAEYPNKTSWRAYPYEVV